MRGGFACGDEIEPAVVVVVECGDALALLPIQIGEFDALEALAFDVAPEADAGRACVREGDIHPAIFVEVEGDDADGGREIFFFEVDGGGERSEFAFAGIDVDGGAGLSARDDEIDSAIVVEIGGGKARAGGVEIESGFGGDVGEGAVAVVAPENVVRGFLRGARGGGPHRDVEIEVAVVVVVDESQADAAGLAANADGFGNVGEFSVLVVEEMNAVGKADGEVGVAVVVVIAGDAALACAGEFDSGGLRDVGKFSVAEIAEEAAGAVGGGADEKEVGLAVVVVSRRSRRRCWREVASRCR